MYAPYDMYNILVHIHMSESVCMICLPPSSSKPRCPVGVVLSFAPCRQGQWQRHRVAGSEPWKADEVDPEGLIGLMGFSGVSWDINIVRILKEV